MNRISNDVKQYIANRELWNCLLITRIVDFLEDKSYIYTTSNAWCSKVDINPDKENFTAYAYIDNTILLEPNDFYLEKFYEDHGLIIYDSEELHKIDAKSKLDAAIVELKVCPEIYETVKKLVKAIQVIHVEDPEYDSSYTHPDIPFSIFVSIGADTSKLSNLRVAESIIHETMHLQLTLIENISPLIKNGSMEMFYSPWREELRPIRGVLHGIYVFSAVKDFYEKILPYMSTSNVKDFVSYRIEEIELELSQIKDFKDHFELTELGTKFVQNLFEIL